MEANPHNPRWQMTWDQFAFLAQALRLDKGTRRVTREQRALLRRVCSSPHTREIPPEQFFVSCKYALILAADNLKLPLGSDRDDRISRLFSGCVEEFYQGPHASEIQPASDRIRLQSTPRVIHSAAKPMDEDCGSAR